MNSLNIQIPGQERNLFFLATPRSLKKRSLNQNANGQLQRYFPKCTEYISANYLKQVAARVASLKVINQRLDPCDFTADDTLYTGASNNRYHYAPQLTLEAKTWTEGDTVYTTTPNVDGPVVHHQDFANGSAFDDLEGNDFDEEKKIVSSTCPRNGNGVSLAYRKAA